MRCTSEYHRNIALDDYNRAMSARNLAYQNAEEGRMASAYLSWRINIALMKLADEHMALASRCDR